MAKTYTKQSYATKIAQAEKDGYSKNLLDMIRKHEHPLNVNTYGEWLDVLTNNGKK